MAVAAEMAVEMAGIEPATATLARRARYLSCHPRPASLGIICLGLPFSRAHAMDVSINLSSLNERLFGTVNSVGIK
jgi:hypothetical protein